jgi:hypothetical protein
MAPTDFTTIDLDAERQRRAAEREVSGDTMPIILGGTTVASLPSELPITALAPLRRLDEEITLLVRAAIDMWREEGNPQARWDATSLIIDILASNPKLPTTAIEVVEEMGRRLLTSEGFDALMAVGLTREDLGFLVGRILTFYGVSLGESSPPSDSSTVGGGETSSTTSEALASTPETSSEPQPAPVTPEAPVVAPPVAAPAPETPAPSSESAAS